MVDRTPCTCSWPSCMLILQGSRPHRSGQQGVSRARWRTIQASKGQVSLGVILRASEARDRLDRVFCTLVADEGDHIAPLQVALLVLVLLGLDRHVADLPLDRARREFEFTGDVESQP